MANKTVNINYLCVIRESNGKTFFETIDIPQSTELISRMEGLCENDNSSVLDLQAQMNLSFNETERRPINYVSPYSYGSSFVDITYFPASLTYAEYDEAIRTKTEQVREDFSHKHETLQKNEPSVFHRELEDHLEKEISRYKYRLKLAYLQQATRYIYASNYTKTIRGAQKQNNLRMFSTDTLGWSDFTYQVTNDITISLGTNFGYGSASYFRLGLRYKGIEILPYSYLVKYYYANRRDLIRYTRLYDVAHDSWNLAFSFVEETANQASASAEEFVREWILNEIKDMVHRLHGVLDNPDEYIHDMLNKTNEKADCDYLTVRNMDSIEKSRYGVYPEEMTMAIRAEKITGALDFLDNLSNLSSTLPEITEYISDIKEMAVAIIPELDEMVKRITDIVAFQQERKAESEVKLGKIQATLAPDEKKIDYLYENRNKEEIWRPRDYFAEKYAETHKVYAEMKVKESDTKKTISKLAEEIRMRSSFRSNLQECRTRVSDNGLIENNSI